MKRKMCKKSHQIYAIRFEKKWDPDAYFCIESERKNCESQKVDADQQPCKRVEKSIMNNSSRLSESLSLHDNLRER